jgi:hypothetical protein
MSRTHSLNKRAIRQAKETDRASELRLSACNYYCMFCGDSDMCSYAYNRLANHHGILLLLVLLTRALYI